VESVEGARIGEVDGNLLALRSHRPRPGLSWRSHQWMRRSCRVVSQKACRALRWVAQWSVACSRALERTLLVVAQGEGASRIRWNDGKEGERRMAGRRRWGATLPES
jgi:hypothetical protein